MQENGQSLCKFRPYLDTWIVYGTGGPSFDSNNNHMYNTARYYTYTKDPTQILKRYFNNT